MGVDTEGQGWKYEEHISGFLAGVATVIVGQPFDTVKVKLQKHNTEVYGIKYRNGLHCTARILKNDGVWISRFQLETTTHLFSFG